MQGTNSVQRYYTQVLYKPNRSVRNQRRDATELDDPLVAALKKKLAKDKEAEKGQPADTQADQESQQAGETETPQDAYEKAAAENANRTVRRPDKKELDELSAENQKGKRQPALII